MVLAVHPSFQRRNCNVALYLDWTDFPAQRCTNRLPEDLEHLPAGALPCAVSVSQRSVLVEVSIQGAHDQLPLAKAESILPPML